jgi:2-polyprenyl-3-methyl-5-hydroxy-6-metoxy-1,4-benzoquinol methylase
MKTTKERWNENWSIYRENAPWESNAVDNSLISYINTTVGIKTALELGCGSGINSVWLAQQGFDVTAIDVAELAIDLTVSTSNLNNVDIKTSTCDILEYNTLEKYDFIFDRGCYHNYSDFEQQTEFVKKVSSLLSPVGTWLSIIGSDDRIDSEGPPKHKLLSIVKCFDPWLDILEIQKCKILMYNNLASPAWKVVSKNKTKE